MDRIKFKKPFVLGRGRRPRAAATATGEPWPDNLGDQCKAIRDLMRDRTPRTLDQVGAAFNGADLPTVANILNQMEGFGVFVMTSEEGEQRWAAPHHETRLRAVEHALRELQQRVETLEAQAVNAPKGG